MIRIWIQNTFPSEIKWLSTMRKGIKIPFVFHPSSSLVYSLPSFTPLFKTNISRIMALILIFLMDGLEALPHPSLELWPPAHTDMPDWARVWGLILICSPPVLPLHYQGGQDHRYMEGTCMENWDAQAGIS